MVSYQHRVSIQVIKVGVVYTVLNSYWYIKNISPLAVDATQNKWRNLRDTFMSHKRSYENKCSSGAGATSEPSWQWWSHLKWLLDHTKSYK